MQIDFHHAVTYAVARLAGFDHREADIISYCAQYVDDATDEGDIDFSNGALYTRIRSAHKMIDFANLEVHLNHRVWIPYHFLPGNGGLPAGEDPGGGFIRKIVCSPDSFVARDMVESAIGDKAKPYGLHRLGITMHVYADTWAHQGFAGIDHEINEVSEVEDGGTGHFSPYVDFLLDAVRVRLGHAKAETLPDMPFLSWRYRNGLGETIERNNPTDFITAANEMCKALQRYRGSEESGLQPADRDVFVELFNSIRSEDGRERHSRWLEEIRLGRFSFGPADVNYNEEEKRWRREAIGVAEDDGHNYRAEFLSSNWKHFHDALQAHRLAVFHEILPRYGICAG